MQKRIGRVTHEGRYVIIEVPDDWHPDDPLPSPSFNDQWFDSFLAFVEALSQPYDRTPIERQPWSPPHLPVDGGERELQLEG